jgi:hypothetical protein
VNDPRAAMTVMWGRPTVRNIIRWLSLRVGGAAVELADNGYIPSRRDAPFHLRKPGLFERRVKKWISPVKQASKLLCFHIHLQLSGVIGYDVFPRTPTRFKESGLVYILKSIVFRQYSSFRKLILFVTIMK